MTPEQITDISVLVYKLRLGDDDTARMLAKDADDGSMLRNRAKAYDGLTRCYLKVLGEPK